MYIFKVFRRNAEGWLTSIIVRGQAEVKYRPGLFSAAPGWLSDHSFHLTALKTFGEALKFAQQHVGKRSVEVWLCEGQDKRAMPAGWALLSALDNGQIVPIDGEFYPGTVMFGRICPLAKIWSVKGDFNDGEYVRALESVLDAVADLNTVADVTRVMQESYR